VSACSRTTHSARRLCTSNITHQYCTHLPPRPALTNLALALRRYGNQAIRFVARFSYAAGFKPCGPADLERIFVCSFFLATDELLIYEPPVRNSGITGGKFFERAKAFKPGTRTYYGPSDFYVGARIPLVSRCGSTCPALVLLDGPAYFLV
jgi:EF-hand domain-containing protein 1